MIIIKSIITAGKKLCRKIKLHGRKPVRRAAALITAVSMFLPSAALAYNVIDLPEKMNFDEAMGIFNADEITRATISNYADRQYIELERAEITELYDNLKNMSLKRQENPVPFRGTALNLYTDSGVKSIYVNSGIELGLYGSSNYICYVPEDDKDAIYMTNIETMYLDSEKKQGGEVFHRASSTDFLRLPAETWSHTSIREAAANNLMPYKFTHKYGSNITREEFCELIANLICILNNYANLGDYMEEKGMPYSTDSFPDCAGRSEAIFMLNAMGIVSGKDNGNFDPDGALTRLEAATLLCRTAEQFMYISTGDDLYFSDSEYIEPWAKYYVIWVNEQSIMNGTDNYFLPNDNYTVLQAIITINRLYKVLMRAIEI